jgi:hypothetical protein
MGGFRHLERAKRYLEKKTDIRKRSLAHGGLEGVDQVVVIPVLAEQKNLFQTLSSLARNHEDERARTLVLCVVNNRAEPHATRDEIADNQRTLKNLDNLIRGRRAGTNPEVGVAALRIASVDASSPGCEISAKAGVGEARKIGLDYALKVLCENQISQRPLIWLDADTTVAPNYLHLVRRAVEQSGFWAGVVAFKHRMPTGDVRRQAIIEYELFLRYHELGLRYARSPYAFQTVGSTIVVRSDAYVAIGGMNRRQAGEDFYFLQQLAKTGGVTRIDSTTVYPSARASNRVPFGTGASIRDRVAGRADHSVVYNPDSYRIIGEWIGLVCGRLDADAVDLLTRAGTVSIELRAFLESQRFLEIWPKLQRNAANSTALKAQFHRWFDGFKTLKLMHFLRDNALPQVPIFDAIREVLRELGVGSGNIQSESLQSDFSTQLELLELLRSTCAGVHPG